VGYEERAHLKATWERDKSLFRVVDNNMISAADSQDKEGLAGRLESWTMETDGSGSSGGGDALPEPPMPNRLTNSTPNNNRNSRTIPSSPFEEHSVAGSSISASYTDNNSKLSQRHASIDDFDANGCQNFGRMQASQRSMISASPSASQHSGMKPPVSTRSAVSRKENPVDLDDVEDSMMRILAGQLTREWRNRAIGAPSLERRLRDFRFAQNKRRDKYGDDRPWGILGLYDHLAGIRIDLEWAEDAAWRREHNEPYLSWADFEATRREGFNKPFFTYILLVVCTTMLVISFGVNGWTIEPLSENPMIGPSSKTLKALGAKDTTLIVIGGEWYRLFSPMFLHAGLIHYFLNMLALWFIGSAVEQCHGFFAAAVIFVIPAVGGTILSALFLPEYLSVGASGGIFGLVGACLADIVMNWNLLFSKQVNFTDKGRTVKHGWVLVWLILDVVVNCMLGLTPFVDNFTHLGGMVYGFLCGLSTMERLSAGFFGVRQDICTHVKDLFVRFFGIFICVASIMATTVLLIESRAQTSPCTGCRYLSCLPMPPWKGDLDKWWYCDDCAMTEAEARKDQTTQLFDQITLTCPNKGISVVDLSDSPVADKAFLSKNLPLYCREHCENVFQN
jgi:membrane associated rhomboid family serine protease